MTNQPKSTNEVDDLQTILRNATDEKDDAKLRGVIKKIVLYMTLGIDVSSLFPEIVKVISSQSLPHSHMLRLPTLATLYRKNSSITISAITPNPNQI